MEKSLLSDENRPNSDSQIALILKSGSFLGDIWVRPKFIAVAEL